MSTFRIPLDPPVPGALAEELARRVYFVSSTITGFTLVRTPTATAPGAGSGEGGSGSGSGEGGSGAAADPYGPVTAVDVTATPLGEEPVDVAGLTRKLRHVVTHDVLAQRPVEPKVVWRGSVAEPPRDVFEELVARGAAAELGEGQIAVGEPVLSLMDHLDAELRSLVMDEFDAREFRYPTLITSAALRRTGYFDSFPHMLMFVTRLHGDVDSYRGFLDSLADGGDLAEGLRAHTGGFDHSLPPTMCFHTYHQYADGPLPAPSTVVTARGKSFRHESRYRRSLERLWDFTIREIVFLGTPEFVLGARARVMERSYALMESLGLGGRCEVAGDPFFLNEATASRAWSQRLLQLKYELRLPLDGERDVAVASFNYHERLFGSSFGIRDEAGDPVYSGCVGFGLERLAYAFLCRHGVDPAGWPEAVRKAVSP
ncbi:hypothetical protein [Streptomyces sp. NPDC058745]|uniref:hypothetical protein n=1 Tax=Streptomyces sp. NPDC058745 TaxID=3346621 RepID=UPI0036A00984